MNINRICDRVIEFSFYALFIIVPLILTPYNYELFEFNKMLTVYFFTVIIASAWIIKLSIKKSFSSGRLLTWLCFYFYSLNASPPFFPSTSTLPFGATTPVSTAV